MRNFYRRLETSVLLSALLVAAAASHAQDTRTVTEPQRPPVCQRLEARYHTTAGGLEPAADAACAKDAAACDAQRIQKAIDQCSAKAGEGKLSVVLATSKAGANAFLLAPLELKPGVALVLDKGITAYGSTNPRDYDWPDEKPGICGTIGTAGHGCRPLIRVDHAHHTSLMGPGTLDGRGGAKMLGQEKSWWQIAREAEEGLRHQNCPRLLVASAADDLTLYDITLKNSPNFHVVVGGTNGFTAWGVKINTPVDARNTDGIDPGNSGNITITRSWIHTGDDNVAVKSGGKGTHHLSITHNHFYAGHGISIGSGTYEGVSDMLVKDLVMQGTANGIRIKSDVTRGGLVKNIRYEDICMKDVSALIGISPFYNDTTIDPFAPTRFKGDRIPHYEDIVIRNVHAVNSGTVLLAGWDDAHRTSVTLDGVLFDGLKKEDIHMQYADVTLGPGKVSFTPEGKEVKTTKATGEPTVVSTCRNVFVPMPE